MNHTRIWGLSVAAVLALSTLSVPLAGSASLANEPRPASTAATPTDALEPGGRPRIVNGQPASVEEFPFVIAGLRDGSSRPKGQSCTGSVVGKRQVLTAAHCMIDVSGDKSYLYGLDDLNGGTGFATEVVEYETHPDYPGPNGWQTGYDVAVVTVADDIPFEGPYPEVAGTDDADLTQPGREGTTIGYGMKRVGDTTDATLAKTTLPVNDANDCQVFDIQVDPETMVCTGYNDGRTGICSGDSGGPLIVDGVIVGVTSWGSSNCDRYGIFARLTNEMGDWANSQIDGTGRPG